MKQCPIWVRFPNEATGESPVDNGRTMILTTIGNKWNTTTPCPRVAEVMIDGKKPQFRPYHGADGINPPHGLAELSSISSEEVKIGRKKISMVPKPRRTAAELLEAAEVELPKCIVNLGTKVATKKKLPKRR